MTVACRALEVSRSGYLAWLKRQPSQRARDDERLRVHIRAAHEAGRQTYGVLRVHALLRHQGQKVGRDRVGRLRREMGLRCRQKRCFRTTTDSAHTLPVAPNLLAQDFSADAPGKVWLTDITYVRTDEGWLYLAGVKDVFTQEIVGYAMSRRMTHELTLEALNRAVRYTRPKPGLLHHSDRGSQYCASRYRERLDALGMRVLMSRGETATTTRRWRVSGDRSRTSCCTSGVLPHVRRHERRSPSGSRCSTTVSDCTVHLATSRQWPSGKVFFERTSH